MIERRNVLEIMSGYPANCFAGSQTRIDLLFTMSEIPHARAPKGRDVRSDVSRTYLVGSQPVFAQEGYAGHASPFASCVAVPRVARRAKRGGARRDRTDDLMLAKHALSQLSYGPVPEDECFKLDQTYLVKEEARSIKWWAWEDLNFRPHAYQARALTN
jgi:hypothetical protein